MRVSVVDRWTIEHVAPGEKARAFVRVVRRSEGTDLGFPILGARGPAPGPTLGLIAGVHGDEFESGEAIRALWETLDPRKLRGGFVGVPTANIPAFDSKHRVSMLDHIPQDMGRMFPEVERGYLSGLIVRALFEQVVRKSTAVLDMHSGGTLLEITPCAIFVPSAIVGKPSGSELLARALGLPYLRRGTGQWHGTLCEAAVDAGIPAVTTEIGGEGRRRQQAVDRASDVILRAGAHLGIWDGEFPQPTATVVEVRYVYTQSAGLYRSRVALEERVSEGQIVGTVTDVFGQLVEEIAAPYSGIVIAQRTYPATQPGELAVGVGQIWEG